MPLIDHFGIIAPFYNRLMRPADPLRFADLLALPTNGWLLDLGGGSGRVARALINLAEHVLVADISPAMLHQVENKTQIARLCSASERLPFPDGFFERVVMVDAFHHVIDQPETAAEMWRVLKPGGRLVIEEPDVRLPGVKLLALAEKLMLMRSHFVSPVDTAALFRDPGAVVSIQTSEMNAWVIVEKSGG